MMAIYWYDYPLVNCYITNWRDPPFCSWVNQLFRLGHFQQRSVKLPEGTPKKRRKHEGFSRISSVKLTKDTLESCFLNHHLPTTVLFTVFHNLSWWIQIYQIQHGWWSWMVLGISQPSLQKIFPGSIFNHHVVNGCIAGLRRHLESLKKELPTGDHGEAGERFVIDGMITSSP